VKRKNVNDTNISDGVFAQATARPHAVAIIDGEDSISYRSLCHGVCRAAKRFQEAGWRPGDIIGISLRGSSALHLLVSLALARSGLTQVAVPPSDPAPLIRSRLRKIGVRGLVSDHALAAASRVAILAPEPGWLVEMPSVSPPADLRISGGDRSWIVAETSGTTAEPKLIWVSHAVEELRRQRQAPLFRHLPGERFLNLTAMGFLSGIISAIRCLADGGTCAIPPAGLNSDQLLGWIDLHYVSYLNCVPLHLHQLLRDIHTDCPRLPSLRILRCGTSLLPVSTLAEVRRRISANIYINYGTNEAGWVTAATPDMLASHPDTVGKPLAGIDLEIADDEDQPLPPGVTGHIRIRGPGIQSSTLRTGTQDQVSTYRNGWFYPGDIGVISESGLLFLKGRDDDVMCFDGIMIGPGEIESVLLQHPAIAQAAAFPLPSHEHQDVPAAAVVSPQPLQLAELARFCQERLGIRAPRLYFQFDEIPKNAMGKVLRNRLTEMALAKIEEGSRR